MFIHDSRYLNSSYRETITTICEGLWPNRAIRLLDGRNRHHPSTPRWERNHRGDYTPAEAREQGLTIWSGASLSGPPRATSTSYLDARYFGLDPIVWSDDYVYLGDKVVPVDSDGTCEPIEVPLCEALGDSGTDQVGEYRLREIAFHYPIRSMCTALVRPSDGVGLRTLLASLVENVVNAEFFSDMATRNAERQQREFAVLAKERSGVAIANLQNQIEQQQASFVAGQRQVTDAERELKLLQPQLESVLSTQNDERDEEAFMREWDSILRHVNVEKVLLTGRRLTVVTNLLTLTHHITGEEVPLGEFDITFDFGANRVSMLNKTHRKGTYDHPHVHNSSFCAGSWQPSVDRLIEERQFAAAVAFVIDALSHYNPDDSWGATYIHWFDN